MELKDAVCIVTGSASGMHMGLIPPKL